MRKIKCIIVALVSLFRFYTSLAQVNFPRELYLYARNGDFLRINTEKYTLKISPTPIRFDEYDTEGKYVLYNSSQIIDTLHIRGTQSCNKLIKLINVKGAEYYIEGHNDIKIRIDSTSMKFIHEEKKWHAERDHASHYSRIAL